MSEWTPPPGVIPQQFQYHPKNGAEKLVRKLDAITTEFRDRFGHLLQQAGIRVEPGRVRFQGSVVVEGDLEVPHGVIKNDWLESPVVPQAFEQLTTGWGVPTSSWHTLAEASLTPPAGFTRALVIASGYWRITYSVAGVTLLGGRCLIAGVPGDEGEVDTTPSPTRSLATSQARLVADLAPGDAVTIGVQIDTPDASTTDANNRARVSGVVLWLR